MYDWYPTALLIYIALIRLPNITDWNHLFLKGKPGSEKGSAAVKMPSQSSLLHSVEGRGSGFPAESITVQWYNCTGTDVPDDSAVNSIFNIHFEEGREECTIDLKFFSLKLLNKNK